MRNVWSKSSISKKMFFCLALVFILYVLFNFFTQIIFYKGIYTYYQKQNMIKNLNIFAGEYNNLSDFDEINSAIVDFSNENGSYIMIMSDAGDILHSLSYNMALADSDGKIYHFSLDRAVHDKSFSNLNLDVGDKITVRYSIVREQGYGLLYNPKSITKNSSEWTADDRKNVIPPQSVHSRTFAFSQEYEVSGIITKVDIPNDFDMRDSIKRNESTVAIMNLVANNIKNNMVIEENKIYIYIYDNGVERYMALAKKIMHEESPQYVFMVNTLHSMDEAIDILGYSFKMWLFAALIVVVFTSLVLSGIITRPVRNISAVTRKMKNLDFSQKCVVHSQDELGILAQNINDMSDKLDTTISELTEANKKLKRDIERERELENQRSEFVAAVSHELKTPLAVIRAYSEGLIDGVSIEKQSKYINVIIDETEKMSALVSDMLKNSKLESGAMDMDIQTHNLSEFVSKISYRLSKTAKERNITVLNDIEPDIYAEFDEYYLEQVVGNFVTNAIRYTPEGMRIFVSTHKDGGYCEVSVENEGSHIEEEFLDKVWNRFYKVDKSRTGEGTGLGLAIAKNILTLHNARYGVENTDAGVRFYFSLTDDDKGNA